MIATAGRPWDEYLVHQLDVDAHDPLADSPAATTGKLAANAIDILLLGDLDISAAAPALLRSLRAGRLHTPVHPDSRS